MLEMLARGPLWGDGLQYAHGTGHGIGAYLNVHEGPIGIGGGTVTGDTIVSQPRMLKYYMAPIDLGMYVSDEPGFYKPGDWGIRIESDLVSVPATTPTAEPMPPVGSRQWLAFEYVTKVPFCRKLIAVDLLSKQETAWIDAYHADVLAALTPLLSEPARAWLEVETAPLQ